MADELPAGISELKQLNSRCSEALDATLQGSLSSRVLRSYSYMADIDCWAKVLANKPESALHSTALSEYTLAILCLCQAQYRNAFKGLRLVLELMLQSVFASTNLLELKEWLIGNRHTNWSRIIEKENGLFSRRFSGIFFEELKDEVGAYRTISETVYSELSECIHGNAAVRIPLPEVLSYDEATCEVWLEKSETIQRVLLFALCMRYLKELRPSQMAAVEASVSDQLGHLAAIRGLFGGVVEK